MADRDDSEADDTDDEPEDAQTVGFFDPESKTIVIAGGDEDAG